MCSAKKKEEKKKTFFKCEKAQVVFQAFPAETSPHRKKGFLQFKGHSLLFDKYFLLIPAVFSP